MKLPDSQRDRMKNPLGILLPEKDTTKKNIQKFIEKNSFVITVGDRTTQKMMEFDMMPSVQIIDGQEKRIKHTIPENLEISTLLTCNNPPAEITPQSVDTIKKAFNSQTPVRIMVTGEEDLLVLPVCIFAPQNSIVMYGQPNEGLVIVTVTPEIRNKTQKLLELME